MVILTTYWDAWVKLLQNPRRRIQIFLISLVIIYMAWALLLFNPLRVSKNVLLQQIQALKLQRTEITNKINVIQEAIKKESVAALLKEKQELENQIQQVQRDLSKKNILFASEDNWIKFKEAIISQQQDMDQYITLISINYSPVHPWAPAIVNKTDAAKVIMETTYEYAIEVKFQSDYFNTIKYITRLEKLPWNLYWDSLTYRVLNYPKAEVTLRLHAFLKQPGRT